MSSDNHNYVYVNSIYEKRDFSYSGSSPVIAASKIIGMCRKGRASAAPAAASTPAVSTRMTRQQRSTALLLSTPMMPAAASSLSGMAGGQQQQQQDEGPVAPGSCRLTGFALTSKTFSRAIASGGPGRTGRGTAGRRRTRRRDEDATFSENVIAISTYGEIMLLVDLQPEHLIRLKQNE